MKKQAGGFKMMGVIASTALMSISVAGAEGFDWNGKVTEVRENGWVAEVEGGGIRAHFERSGESTRFPMVRVGDRVTVHLETAPAGSRQQPGRVAPSAHPAAPSDEPDSSEGIPSITDDRAFFNA